MPKITINCTVNGVSFNSIRDLYVDEGNVITIKCDEPLVVYQQRSEILADAMVSITALKDCPPEIREIASKALLSTPVRSVIAGSEDSFPLDNHRTTRRRR